MKKGVVSQHFIMFCICIVILASDVIFSYIYIFAAFSIFFRGLMIILSLPCLIFKRLVVGVVDTDCSHALLSFPNSLVTATGVNAAFRTQRLGLEERTQWNRPPVLLVAKDTNE